MVARAVEAAVPFGSPGVDPLLCQAECVGIRGFHVPRFSRTRSARSERLYRPSTSFLRMPPECPTVAYGADPAVRLPFLDLTQAARLPLVCNEPGRLLFGIMADITFDRRYGFPMSTSGAPSRKKALRTAIAIGVVVAAMVLQDTLLRSVYEHMREWLGIPVPPANTFVCSAYSLLTGLRLTWWLAVVALITFMDPPGISPFLRLERSQAMNFVKGVAVGLLVMTATVLMIAVVGDAQIHSSGGSAATRAAQAVAWFLAKVVSAAGEEVLYRGLLLILVTRLLGMRAGMAISALAFVAGHGANPGASTIWMVRLAIAALLLAYSVFRSGAIWWATGYHAGWNFASAPLFGAAGSGFHDQGTVFTFRASGSAWITGGPVGPEGSVFAFLAVLLGIGLLVLTVPRQQERQVLRL